MRLLVRDVPKTIGVSELKIVFSHSFVHFVEGK